MNSYIIIFIFFVSRILAEAKDSLEKGTVIREVWDQVRGDSIQNLLADVRFPHKPSKVSFLKTFDTPTNDGVHFAQRLKGYFIAPKTGEYKFYSSCDDECEVFLGLDGKEGENNRIISQRRSSMHNEFDRYPDQVSHSIFLEKGKSYYLEEIGRQDTGRESLSLGVELPDGKRFFPIPGSLLSKYISRTAEESHKSRTKKGKKKHEVESESSEMAEGSLGKISVSGGTGKKEGKATANGEKKSIKSDDYPEDSRFYSDKDGNSEKNQEHAVLEVDGAEIEEQDANQKSDGKTQSMFTEKSNSHGNLEEFELNPRLEVTPDIASNGFLNEAGIEKAVEEALKQRNDKADNHENEVAFMGPGKQEAKGDLEGHGNEARNQEAKQMEEEQASRSNGNDTVLEMNKIAKEAGQVAMNLVNVTNFKVVIPGGKTYEISGSPGKKPLVTVVPDEGIEKRENRTSNESDTKTAMPNMAQSEPVEKAKGREALESSEEGKTVTAVQHGNQIDVHVDKKTGAQAMAVPQMVPTGMDQPAAGIQSPIMGTPLLEHPFPILDSSVASLMYNHDHTPMEHQPINEHPIVDHHEPHLDNMHIEVNSSVPVHEAPKPQKLDPEVIKVEFLPEGISVDTASSKIAKKCNDKNSKRSLDCKESSNEEEKETQKADTKTIPNQTAAKSTSLMPGKVEAAPEAKMFVAPVAIKGAPGDVTVVPAERQEAVTRVIVQDTAGEKNESRLNFVKVSPVSKVQEASTFPTITGSVMNNQTGKPVPFEVKVVSNQQEAQQLAGGKGANFTISGDSRTYASGVATGPNKKGQQQTIIVLPDVYQKHASGDSKANVAGQPTKETPKAAEQQQPSEKTASTGKTFPVTMDTPPDLGGGGGGGGGAAGGEFIFPDLSTLNPGSDSTVVPIGGNQVPNQNDQGIRPGMNMPPMAPMAQQQQPQAQPDVAQQQQQQQPGQDRVLIGPPDNIYHGPILSPIANEFMTDLNRGSFSTEEAMDLMNNYVSGSQDMTSSIKKLAGVLNKVHTRDQTQGKSEQVVSNLTPQKGNGFMMKAMGGQQNSMNMPPMSQTPVNPSPMNGLPQFKENGGQQQFNEQGASPPSGGEIAALLAIGPNKQYGGGEMEARFENNLQDPNQRSFRGNPFQENRFERNENFEPNNYNEQHQLQNSFAENQGDAESPVARMNQLQKEKPPPVHFFQGGESNAVSPFPEENSNMFNGGQRRGEPMGQFNGMDGPMGGGFRENGIMPFMENTQRQRPEFQPVPNSVDNFLNRIDPHEMSPNPSVAMPENGLARHTLSKRPSEPHIEPHFQSEQLRDFTGQQKMHEKQNEEFTKQASVERFHSNRGNSISDLYSDSLFPEDIADIESLRGSLQGKTLSAYDRQEEAPSQTHAQGRSEIHQLKSVKVSFPLRGVTKQSKFKGALRSHIAARRTKRKKSSHAMIRGKRRWRKMVLNGSKRSGLSKGKMMKRKEKRDLVSIVPNHRQVQSKAVEPINGVMLGQAKVEKEESKFVKENKGKANLIKEITNWNADAKDSMTDVTEKRFDADKSHLKKIAMELKDILSQLHNGKKRAYDIWEGKKMQEKQTLTNTIGSDYEVEYVKGKVTDEDLNDKSSSPYQSPDAERFQQDVWEPGSRGEGSMLGALVNSKRGVLAKVNATNKDRRNKIAVKEEKYQPYFKDWKLDEEIRLLQQL